MLRPGLVGLMLLAAAGCAREPDLFVEANARAHIGMIAGTIGSRPVGSSANARARAYIVEQLTQAGLEVRVQEVDARRHELGQTTRVANVIGILAGDRPEALALVTHYDSRPSTPGAADAALGVGVAIEAARVLAARDRLRWTLMVLVTDAEEAMMMGAAGLMQDAEVVERVRACINLDAIGSRGTAVLFETGPASAAYVRAWARHAPHPRGGSYAAEIYRRLPNDTDFSIFSARGLPGLNFAPALDSYAYHTPGDTPERLARHTVRSSGENIVSLIAALQDVDITARSAGTRTFFDIGGTAALSYGATTGAVAAVVALLLGTIAWIRLTRDTVHDSGAVPWIIVAVWTWLSAAVTVAAMVAATWLLRSAREVYHPWYAYPGRLFVLLILVAATVAWSMARIGQWLPPLGHPERHPALAWSVTLPAWIGLAALSLWYVPVAAYLWVLPLAAAGALMSWLPPGRDALVRIASLLVLAVSATMWLPETHDVLRFAVPMLGRQPMVTPAAAYGIVLAVAGIMVVPPLVALLAPERRLARPSLVTAGLLLASAAAALAAYVAPAYTADQPLRRHVRAVQDGQHTVWEVASIEPGLDLGDGAPEGWKPASDPPGISVPVGRLPHAFVFRTEAGPALGVPPVAISAFDLTPLAGGLHLRLALVPSEPGLTVRFVLSEGLTPARSTLPGTVLRNRWAATFTAVPQQGIAWEAEFHDVTAEELRATRVSVTAPGFPDSAGWQRLPAWLPQERAAWTSSATWIVPAASGPLVAPVPPLR